MLHFQEELEALQERLLEMGSLVESAIEDSLRALLERDGRHAEQVFRTEARINRLDIEIDERATRLLALYQPMARDLRLLTAVIKINADLERMGDQAVNVAERAASIMSRPPSLAPLDIPHMARQAQNMVRRSLDSFVRRDGEMARAVLLSDDEVDEMKKAAHEQLLQVMQAEPQTIPAAVDLMFVAHSLERIADHATNVAEDVLFLVKGIDVRHYGETGKPAS